MFKLTRSSLLLANVLLLSNLTAACGSDLVLDRDDIPDEISTATKAQALEVLHALFPDLSGAELRDISRSLSLDDLLALEGELRAARKVAVEFSEALFTSSEERVADREQVLESRNDGFPEGLGVAGQVCTYDSESGRGEVRLSGVFSDKEAVVLQEGQVTLTLDGAEQVFSLTCMQGGPSVDIVFLVDITGSMANVIASVRDSVVKFVDLIEASGIRGTVSVVTFQDTVGVNRTFQEPAPAHDYERSPFFAPVSLSDASAVERVRDFVNRLEANQGADASENLSGAIDFARNNVIGYTAKGAPNVIGDGREDPAGTQAFPKLRSERQVFVALTDITFHGDRQDEHSSSLLSPFVPRDASDILASLHQQGTVVHVSDPSWVDASLASDSADVDADYWAIHTGGVGEDWAAGYSLVDLELVVVSSETGLLDITLDKVLATSCTLDFKAELSANAKLELSLEVDGKTFSKVLAIERY